MLTNNNNKIDNNNTSYNNDKSYPLSPVTSPPSHSPPLSEVDEVNINNGGINDAQKRNAANSDSEAEELLYGSEGQDRNSENVENLVDEESEND
eukprot:Awhi_evm2s14314